MNEDTVVSEHEGKKADRMVPNKSPMRVATAQHRPESWRLMGIMSEFIEATERLKSVSPAVSIFGSARTPKHHPYYQLTEVIAKKLSDAGFSVISGGGPGIMEAANKGAIEGKSPSIGLNILLPNEQSGNGYQTISLSFRHFFARKVMFARFASAYVVMPGGFGTIDELSEALTLIQTGKARQMPIVLVGTKFWQGCIDWFKDTLVAEGMIAASDIDLMHVTDDPDDVVNHIFSFYEESGLPTDRADSDYLANL
jgi:uncharacterized protein (TIGR00730 family)